MEQHYPFTLPPLPYGYDALAPELIEKVLYFHHDKHFAAYVGSEVEVKLSRPQDGRKEHVGVLVR